MASNVSTEPRQPVQVRTLFGAWGRMPSRLQSVAEGNRDRIHNSFFRTVPPPTRLHWLRERPIELGLRARHLIAASLAIGHVERSG